MKIWHGYSAAVSFLLIGSLFVPKDSVFPPIHTLEDPAKASLEIVDNILKLLVTLNTTLLAAAATMAIKAETWTSKWTRTDSMLVVLVFLCGAVSYFGVFFVQVRVLTMVNAAALNPLETGLTWGLRLAYMGIIVGVVLLGLVFSRIVEGRLGGAAG